jgi:hypothetical protein
MTDISPRIGVDFTRHFFGKKISVAGNIGQQWRFSTFNQSKTISSESGNNKEYGSLTEWEIYTGLYGIINVNEVVDSFTKAKDKKTCGENKPEVNLTGGVEICTGYYNSAIKTATLTNMKCYYYIGVQIGLN